VRVLGIESSSRRASVALVEGGQLLARADSAVQNAHAEALVPLLDRVLRQVGWTKRALDRVGVGVGPGSFTGVRVGMAFAQGIALGLGIPWLGVPSLAAMVRAYPGHEPGARVALLDARRGELFAAAYDAQGTELWPARTLARGEARAVLDATLPRPLLLGEVAAELGLGEPFRSELTDLPDAAGVAWLAAEWPLESSSRQPLYVRDAGATPQLLPPSPLA
jgi:tRNA threonylcarbamoyladenosine biosynthesis protein TsaB